MTTTAKNNTLQGGHGWIQLPCGHRHGDGGGAGSRYRTFVKNRNTADDHACNGSLWRSLSPRWSECLPLEPQGIWRMKTSFFQGTTAWEESLQRVFLWHTQNKNRQETKWDTKHWGARHATPPFKEWTISLKSVQKTIFAHLQEKNIFSCNYFFELAALMHWQEIMLELMQVSLLYAAKVLLIDCSAA